MLKKIFSRTRTVFEVKEKTFLLVLQLLSFRYKKQTSWNVEDPTCKQNPTFLSFSFLVGCCLIVFSLCLSSKNYISRSTSRDTFPKN